MLNYCYILIQRGTEFDRIKGNFLQLCNEWLGGRVQWEAIRSWLNNSGWPQEYNTGNNHKDGQEGQILEIFRKGNRTVINK